ncbi:hypothetical protein IW245_008009 [Longispora fulva]|uniref:Uncharacterized protein n=1 Tax=Longispora fulva TaxID=619741 RepID=A0A8J7H0U6_9ACTN|nr:hypothetical protein [Longispora fulva]
MRSNCAGPRPSAVTPYSPPSAGSYSQSPTVAAVPIGALLSTRPVVGSMTCIRPPAATT